MIVDLLVGDDLRHRAIVESAFSEPTSDGVVRLARREDLIWLKELRGSDQDQVDIRRLRRDSD